MLNLSDEIQPYLDQKMPLLKIHRFDGTRCSCGNPACQWDSEKGGSAGKHPAEKNGVHGAEPRTNAKIFAGKNAGVACGRGFVILDIDPRNGGNESLARLLEANGSLPKTWQVASGGGGTHYYFSVEGEQRGGKRVDGVDLIGLGGYALTAGSVHPNQKQYEWEIHPSECAMAPLPEWVRDVCCGVPVERPTGQNVSYDSVYDEQDLRDALEFLDPNMGEPQWREIGLCIHSAGFPIEIWDEWSQKSNRYSKDVLEEKWSRFVADKPGGKTIRSLFWLAEEAGWKPRTIEKWDFQKLASERVALIEIVSPQAEPEIKKERNFPEGLAGELAHNVLERSMWKDREFAITTAISQICAIAQGRHVTPMDNGSLSYYGMLIARSGGGKNDYTKAFGRCIKAADLILDMGEVASPQALRRVLEQCNSRAYVIDEGLEWLELLVTSKDAMQKKLHADFRTAWSGSDLTSITTKDAANNSPSISNPKITILGGGPYDSFLKLLHNGSALASDGLLSRFDFVIGNPKVPKSFIKKPRFVVTDSMARDLKEILQGSGGRNFEAGAKQASNTLKFETITRVDWTEQAERAFDDFAHFCHERQNKSGLSAVWSRVAEKSVRVASGIAISCNPRKPIISLGVMNWAIDRQMDLAINTESVCRDNLGKSQEALCRDRIVYAVKKEGGACSRKKVGKWWRGWSEIDERVRQAAVDGLQRDGIVSVTVSGASRNKGEQIFVLLSV